MFLINTLFIFFRLPPLPSCFFFYNVIVYLQSWWILLLVPVVRWVFLKKWSYHWEIMSCTFPCNYHNTFSLFFLPAIVRMFIISMLHNSRKNGNSYLFQFLNGMYFNCGLLVDSLYQVKKISFTPRFLRV